MTTCLNMAEGLSLRSAGAAREQILEALNAADGVELILADDAPVDLCGVQLIEAARIHAAAIGKSIALGRPGDALRPLLESAGFLTDPSPESLAFWFHEGAA